MSNEKDGLIENRSLMGRVTHVVGRTGLAMSGAMGGTFVAAYLARTGIEPLLSVGFIASMILIGMIGFYLGIDIPRMRAPGIAAAVNGLHRNVEAIELLG